VQNHSYSSSTDFIGQLRAKLVGLTPHLNQCRVTFGSNKNVINSKSLSVVDPSSLRALVQFYSHSTHHNIPAPFTSIQTFAQIVISDTNTCEGGSQLVQRQNPSTFLITSKNRPEAREGEINTGISLHLLCNDINVYNKINLTCCNPNHIFSVLWSFRYD
jgi:hypothetical protein